MGMITIKTQSAASVPLPAVDQLRLFVDSSDSILKTKDSFGTVRPSGVGTADELSTTGAPVDVSASSPPTTGQVLMATSATTAVWTTIATGPATQLDTTGAAVTVGSAAPPTVGQVLTATSATNATWQDPTGGGLTQTAILIGGTDPDYNAAVGDLVRCDVTGDDQVVNLPAGHTAGDQIGIKMVSTTIGDVVAVFGNGGDLIDGASPLILDTDYEWAILQSDGTNWMQIG